MSNCLNCTCECQPEPTIRIDHAAEARRLLANADRMGSMDWPTQTGEYKADVLAEAQVHATLALVEQQRIANRIALAGYVDCDIPEALNQLAHDALGTLTAEGSKTPNARPKPAVRPSAEQHSLNELLSPKELEQFTDGALKQSTLAWWRHRDDGSGPPWLKLGPRKVMYKKSDVEAWLNEKYDDGAALDGNDQ